MTRTDVRRGRLRRVWRFLRWRAALPFIVFAVAFLSFEAGVGVTDRAGLADGPLLSRAYYALGLFVLGGMDLGVPAGGPAWARGLLWLAYFAAPALTASAVIEGVLRALGPRSWAIRRMSGHVVVAGCGQLSMQFLAQLRRQRPRTPVVVVEQRDRPEVELARDLHGALVLIGDVTSGVLLGTLRLDHALRVVLLTGDDFVNLDTAAKVLALAPHLEKRIVAHVADLNFVRSVADTEVARAVHIFNTHQIAAEHLVAARILAQFDRTVPLDTVVIAGFGRFGQTVLDELQTHALGKFARVYLVDVACSLGARLFAESVGFREGYQRHVIEGDLRDPELWRGLEGGFGHEPVVIVGSGEDAVNLHAALWLRARYPKAYVVARSSRRSAFAAQVARSAGFELVSVAELVDDSLAGAWFTS